MSVSKVLVYFTSIYIIGVISLGAVLTFVNLSTKNLGVMLVAFVLFYVLKLYAKENNAVPQGIVFWKIFAGVLGVLTLISITAILYISSVENYMTKSQIFSFFLVQLITNTFMTWLSLWIGSKVAKRYIKSERSTNKIKVFSVTDRMMAEHLVELLQKTNIRAYADLVDENNQLGGIVNTASGIDIVLYDDEDYDMALEIINNELNTEEIPEDWTCPKCGELVEKNFNICWNCQHEYSTTT